MVVFVCNGCNTSLRRNNVESHIGHFAKCKTVSCLDCFKDFDNTTFKTHLQCISEKEKYDKLSAKQVISKQDIWTKNLQKLIDECTIKDNSLRALLNNLKGCANVPQKKKKFDNFMSSKNRHITQTLIDKVWDLLNTVKPVNLNVHSKSEFPKVKKSECENANTTSTDNLQDEQTKSASKNRTPDSFVNSSSNEHSRRMKREFSDAPSNEVLVNHVKKPKKPKLEIENVSSETNALEVERLKFSFKKLIPSIIADCGGTTNFRHLKHKLYSLYKSSVLSDQDILTKNQFKELLLSKVKSGKYCSYSSNDSISLIDHSKLSSEIKKTEEFIQSIQNETSNSTCVPSESSDSINLAMRIIEILKSKNAPVSLKKLKKKLLQVQELESFCVKYSNEERFEKKILRVIKKEPLLNMTDNKVTLQVDC